MIPNKEARFRPFEISGREMARNRGTTARRLWRGGETYRAIGAITGHRPMSVRRILERMERSAS
jgi:hypothetical protein